MEFCGEFESDELHCVLCKVFTEPRTYWRWTYEQASCNSSSLQFI